jgi:anti-sigma B factor antagonist
MDAPAITRVTLRRSEYDVFSQPDLRQELEALRPGRCIIDFGNVQYLDSTSLGSLIRRLKQLREDDPKTHFTLTNVSPQVANVFKITSLDSVFDIEESSAD